MKFIGTKTAALLDLQALDRVRERLVSCGCVFYVPSCRASWRRETMSSGSAWCTSSQACQQIGAAWMAHRRSLRRD